MIFLNTNKPGTVNKWHKNYVLVILGRFLCEFLMIAFFLASPELVSEYGSTLALSHGRMV